MPFDELFHPAAHVVEILELAPSDRLAFNDLAFGELPEDKEHCLTATPNLDQLLQGVEAAAGVIQVHHDDFALLELRRLNHRIVRRPALLLRVEEALARTREHRDGSVLPPGADADRRRAGQEDLVGDLIFLEQGSTLRSFRLTAGLNPLLRGDSARPSGETWYYHTPYIIYYMTTIVNSALNL